jgi:succinyl-CoA synthetase beta subunit
MNLDIPAVIRLGGNSEDRAVEVLMAGTRDLPATIEGYRKDDAPAKIAKRFAALVEQADGKKWQPRSPRKPDYVGQPQSVAFAIKAGKVWIDASRWPAARAIIDRVAPQLLRDDGGRPSLNVKAEEFATKDSELIAAEVECRRANLDALFVDLDLRAINEPMNK